MGKYGIWIHPLRAHTAKYDDIALVTVALANLVSQIIIDVRPNQDLRQKSYLIEIKILDI